MNISVVGILGLFFLSCVLLGWSLVNAGITNWVQITADITRNAETSLRRLFLFADARKLLSYYLVLIVAAPLLMYGIGLSITVSTLLFIALISAPKIVFARLASARRLRISAELPDALNQIAGAMRAGSTFTMAIQAMVEENPGPLGQEFSLLLREQRLGTRLDEALENLGERVQSEEMDLMISATLIAQDVGGNLAEILQRLAQTIRKKQEMEGKIRSLTAQGVLQGRVVTLLPFAILLALLIIEPEAISPMFTRAARLGVSCGYFMSTDCGWIDDQKHCAD